MTETDGQDREIPQKIMRAETIWITWENQRRNRELARALSIRLYEWSDIDPIETWLFKYSVGVFRTLVLLARERPHVAFCQNPSTMLAFLLLLVRPLTGAKVFVDAHNAGLLPIGGRSKALNRIARWIQRHADLTLVTNDGLKRIVERNGGRAFVLPDKIPDPGQGPARPPCGRLNALFICSYAEDEPYLEVFEAARRLDPDVFVHVTGNHRKKNIDPASLPRNVALTGYLPEGQYWEALRSADIVIDLTERDDCLVCGAYEAVAAGKPMVLSDKKANRLYFNHGAVYARHDPDSIANAIREALERKDTLSREVAVLRETRTREWESLRRRLVAEIDAAAKVGGNQ